MLVGHAESIYIETEKEIDIELAKNCLNEFSGISVIDDVQEVNFPTSLSMAMEQMMSMLAGLERDLVKITLKFMGSC